MFVYLYSEVLLVLVNSLQEGVGWMELLKLWEDMYGERAGSVAATEGVRWERNPVMVWNYPDTAWGTSNY